jgi:hypothetical protein
MNIEELIELLEKNNKIELEDVDIAAKTLELSG